MMTMKLFGGKRLLPVLLIALVWGLGNLCRPDTVHAEAVEPFIGEISCGGWNFCPLGWEDCRGQLLLIAEHDALFSLIGTTYGGDGQSTFALPDIQGRTLVHQGQGPSLSNRVIGQTGGAETVTLTTSQMPLHNHPMAAHTVSESASPTNRIAGNAAAPVYTSSAADTTLGSTAVGTNGWSQPHDNLQPYLAVKCCIALFGIYPSQN